jgi:pilus assembly protein FimV
MLRKCTLAIAVALAMAPAAGYGLGIGEIKPNSLMGHVFEGSIDLTDVTADELPNIKVRLAPPEAFRKAGVELTGPVRRLRFKPYVQANGRPAIRVTSTESIREPYLNFLVEVEWSQGRTVKELTVLLDPPTFTERRAPQVQAPVATPREAPSAPASATRSASGSPPAAAAPIVADGHDYGPVKQGETLWRIAERNRARGVSAEQAMIAILQANPDAFVGGNINRLKAGARLKLPSTQQVAALDPLQARDVYLRQMGRPVPERPATRAAPSTPPPAGDMVRLVTPPPDAAAPPRDAVAPATQVAAAPDLRQDVLLAHEKAESARQTADQLQGRVSDLESQLRDLQRLLVLKDTQLTQLQEKAEEAVKAAQAVAAAKPEPAAAPATAVTETKTETVTPAEPKAEAPRASAPVPEPKPAEAAVASAPRLAEPTPVAVAPAPSPKPSQASALAGLLSDPANALGAGIAGVGVLGAMLWAILGRRRSTIAEPAPSEPTMSAAMAGAAAPKPSPVLAPAVAVPEPVVAAAAGPARPHEVDRVATEDLAALDVSATDLVGLKGETNEVDPTEEADVYIAYGRYEQAEQLLRLALEIEPGRLALQRKLLEVHAASRDPAAFGALFAQLEAAGKATEDPSGWEQALRLGRQIDPANPRYAGGDIAAEALPDDALARARRDLDVDLDRIAGKGEDFGELSITSRSSTEAAFDDIDAGSVLNDLSLDLSTEDAGAGKSSHPFKLDVAEELEGGRGGPGGLGNIEAAEALAWGLDRGDATGLVESEISPADVIAEQLDDAPRDVPDLGDLEIGPDTAMDLGADTTMMHADTTLELVDDVETKLDLARAYVELGDEDSARLMLQEAMQEGNAAQKTAAEALLKELG